LAPSWDYQGAGLLDDAELLGGIDELAERGCKIRVVA